MWFFWVKQAHTVQWCTVLWALSWPLTFYNSLKSLEMLNTFKTWNRSLKNALLHASLSYHGQFIITIHFCQIYIPNQNTQKYENKYVYEKESTSTIHTRQLWSGKHNYSITTKDIHLLAKWKCPAWNLTMHETFKSKEFFYLWNEKSVVLHKWICTVDEFTNKWKMKRFPAKLSN